MWRFLVFSVDVIYCNTFVFGAFKICLKLNTFNFLCLLIDLFYFKGVIFSIDYNYKHGLICSSSDDRSTVIWTTEGRNLLKELSKSEPNVTSTCTVHGHTARVFRCKTFTDYIVTAGEDSIINVWSINGDLIKRFNSLQRGSIWALDYDDKTRSLISGGADGSVTCFRMNPVVPARVLRGVRDTPKRVRFLNDRSVVSITETGILVHYDTKDNQFKQIAHHSDLDSYALLETSDCGRFVALAGIHGTIHLYRTGDFGLERFESCQVRDERRVFALHWLSCKYVLTCFANGLLVVWKVSHELTPVHVLRLPLSKERWTTCGSLCGKRHIIVGDRRGNLYLYSWSSTEPVYTYKRAHNYLGVTSTYYERGRVVSLGEYAILFSGNGFKM